MSGLPKQDNHEDTTYIYVALAWVIYMLHKIFLIRIKPNGKQSIKLYICSSYSLHSRACQFFFAAMHIDYIHSHSYMYFQAICIWHLSPS